MAYVGGFTVGAAIPSLATAQASLSAELAAKFGELTARAAAVVEISAGLAVIPPNIAASIAALEAALVAAAAAMANPAGSVTVTVIADLGAEIAGLILEVEAGLAAVASLGSLLATGGIHMYLLENEIGSMGSQLTTDLSSGMPGGSGPTQEGVAVVLLAGSPVSIQALRTVFGQ